jgi:hypothetical protein
MTPAPAGRPASRPCMGPSKSTLISRILHFLHTSFFVRLGIPFLRPDPHVLEVGAHRGCQGRPSLWPGGTLRRFQAAPWCPRQARFQSENCAAFRSWRSRCSPECVLRRSQVIGFYTIGVFEVCNSRHASTRGPLPLTPLPGAPAKTQGRPPRQSFLPAICPGARMRQLSGFRSY